MAEKKLHDLILREGEDLRFPVKEGHPFFEAQEVKPIESLDDIANFEFVRLWAHYANVRTYSEEIVSVFEAEAPEDVRRARLLAEHFPTPEAFVIAMAELYGQKLELSFADFIVPAGSTVELSNKINEINARRAIITGTLRSRGALAINAEELGG